ncbi:hypothetical protein RZS08_34915, partial [Arthrospira platensis SPKY1]|nr:hypothetical protein [Arthrospira platensis SPKY1]
MKRFFYTTAAVVAFAFSGMANTIELEEDILESNHFINVLDVNDNESSMFLWPPMGGVLSGLNTCIQVRDEVYNELIQNFPHEEAADNALQYFIEC